MKKDSTKKPALKKPKKLKGLDQINFDEIFRLKGKEGLWCPASEFNKSGLVNCVKFLDSRISCIGRNLDIVLLGNQKFITYAGNDDLSIKEVFQNMMDYLKVNKSYTFDKDIDFEMMAIMVPEFDEIQFKNYQAKWVVVWFNEIMLKLKQLKDVENA